jgi:glycosyltransferase involved in cell wall biosynthesis
MAKVEVKRALLLAGLMASHVATRYTLTLAKALSQREMRVHVVCARGSRIEAFHQAHIAVDSIAYLDHPVLFRLGRRSLLSIVAGVQPQVLHVQDLELLRVGARLATATGLPLLASVLHSPYGSKDNWLLRPEVRRFIAVNEAVREDLVNVARVPKDRIAVVPEGIDVSEYPMWSGATSGSVPTVGIIAPFEKPYGHESFLAAAKLIHTSSPDIQFLIAGDGSLEEDIRRQVIAQGLSKNVVFASRIGDYRPFLEVVDILVMPAVQDGISFSIMEAMAMGKVVIASSIGGIYVLLKNEETGYLVGRGDTGEIARRVLELVKNRSQARKIGENARRFVEQNFGLTSLALRTIRVYEDVVGAR